MRSLLLAATLLPLAACETAPPKPDYAQILGAWCKQGVMDACVAAAQIEAEDRRAQAQASDALLQTGAMLLQQSQPQPYRPFGFTCTTVGAFTNCY